MGWEPPEVNLCAHCDKIVPEAEVTFIRGTLPSPPGGPVREYAALVCSPECAAQYRPEEEKPA